MYIDAEKLIAEIEKRNLSNRYITTEGYEQELYELIDSFQQEQSEAIVGVVHHALGTHWIVTNQEQLGARLKQFPEGAEVEILIEAKKEESNENTKNIQAHW